MGESATSFELVERQDEQVCCGSPSALGLVAVQRARVRPEGAITGAKVPRPRFECDGIANEAGITNEVESGQNLSKLRQDLLVV